MTIIWIAFSVINIGLLVLIVLSIISRYSNNVWFCKVMGWHKSPLAQGFDGCSLHGKCPRCKKKVLQDSNGDWF